MELKVGDKIQGCASHIHGTNLSEQTDDWSVKWTTLVRGMIYKTLASTFMFKLYCFTVSVGLFRCRRFTTPSVPLSSTVNPSWWICTIEPIIYKCKFTSTAMGGQESKMGLGFNQGWITYFACVAFTEKGIQNRKCKEMSTEKWVYGTRLQAEFILP